MPDKRALILLEDDVNRLVEALTEYQETTRTLANMVLDTDGHILAQTGESKVPLETITAFVAASYAATRQVAKILAPDEFILLTHEGVRSSIELAVVGDRVVLATIYDEHTTTGVVVFYIRELVARLSAVVKGVAARKVNPVELAKDFGDDAKGAIDDLLGSSSDDLGSAEQ